jgi:hypothetical protein
MTGILCSSDEKSIFNKYPRWIYHMLPIVENARKFGVFYSEMHQFLKILCYYVTRPTTLALVDFICTSMEE